MQPAPIVEVGRMGIQPGKTPLDPSTRDGRILRDAWESIIAAPGGPERIYWGVERGDAARLWGWFDWASLGAHEAFAESFGGNATREFGKVFTPGFTKHAYLSTSPLRCPLTQIVAAFFPDSITGEAKDGVAQSFECLRTSVLERKGGVVEVSGGWGMETDFPVRGRSTRAEGDAEKGAVFFVLVGWETGDEGAMEEVRENIALTVEMHECVAWDEFCLECEVLERTIEEK